MSINVGIMGYGNLGRGVELALRTAEDMRLAAIFTRRNPANVPPHGYVPVVGANDAAKWQDSIDVMIMCGGSYNDLPEQTPRMAPD